MQSNSVTRNHVIVLSLVWLSVHVILFFYPGIRLELFDSKVYTNAGDYFMHAGTFEKNHQVFYAIPIVLIGLFNSIPHGLICFIIFQSLISALATFAIYRSASILFSDSRAGLLAALFFLFWWDTIQWNTALLTESLFCSVICFLVYRLIRFNDSKSDYFILIILFWLCVITRPTGVIFLTSVMFFLLKRYEGFLRGERLVKITVIGLTIVLAVLAGIVMFSIWDFSDQYVRGNIVTYIDTSEGNDYGLRLGTADLVLPNPNDSPLEKMIGFVYHNPIHFIHAGILKIFYLISGVRPFYSFSHNALNVVWNTMIYFLFVVGYKHCTNHAMRAFALTVIIINCLLIGISTVDWDNRFYVPMVPVLVVFSAGGSLHLLKRFLRARTSQ